MRQRRKRRYCTAAESAEIWDRWQKGEGLKSIGRVFDKSSASIFADEAPTSLPALRAVLAARDSAMASWLAHRQTA
jgi:hypothetical protein